MLTRTVVFDSVKRSRKVNYICTRCNKKRTKIVSTEYTVNPFNKNSQGIPKTYQEVTNDVWEEQAKRIASVEKGDKCNKCKDEIIAERTHKFKKQLWMLFAVSAPYLYGGNLSNKANKAGPESIRQF